MTAESRACPIHRSRDRVHGSRLLLSRGLAPRWRLWGSRLRRFPWPLTSVQDGSMRPADGRAGPSLPWVEARRRHHRLTRLNSIRGHSGASVLSMNSVNAGSPRA